jgi:hypothetical protein
VQRKLTILDKGETIMATTLDQLFSFEESTRDQLSAVVKSEEFEPIKKRISRQLKGAPLPEGFFEHMMKQVHELLDIDLRAILVRAWVGSEALLNYVAPEKTSTDETLLLRLAEHTVTSQHAPSLKPSLNNVPLGEIKFKILLELTLKGVILKVRNGRIMEFTIGSCEGKGDLRVGDFSLIEKEFEPVALQGSVDLGEGIPIQQDVEEIAGRLASL